jgi:type IV secretion system protein VirB10
MILRPIFASLLLAGTLAGQVPAQEPAGGWPKVSNPAPGDYQIAAGTKVPLSLINSISTKHSAEGDRVYLETAFPILSGGRIVIPVGSYVAGTVTQVKRPGRVKGRGELFVRFDSLTLPNGVTRDFRARMGGMDGASNEELDRAEGKVKSEGNKGGDARTIGEAAGTGASVGAIAGSVGGNAGKGLGIGAAAGAAAGLIGVLASRGPDAILQKGTTIEMVLDRPLSFTEAELNFGSYQPPRAARSAPPAETNTTGTSSRRRLPF